MLIKLKTWCQLGRSLGLPENYLRERSELEFGDGLQIPPLSENAFNQIEMLSLKLIMMKRIYVEN